MASDKDKLAKYRISVEFTAEEDQYPNCRRVHLKIAETVPVGEDPIQYLKRRLAEAVHEKLELEMDPKVDEIARLKAELEEANKRVAEFAPKG